MININNILEFVNTYYKDKDIMHNLDHINRVLKSVDKLMDMGNYTANMDIITYATYFHGFIYMSENNIIEWLQSQGLTDSVIRTIIKVSWESQKDEIAETLEGKILHDAHMIEGGKTYLIVKALITGSLRGQTLEQTIKYIDEHKGMGICYLPEARQIYHTQQEFAEAFIVDLKEGLM